jgi:hypothetical protein
MSLTLWFHANLCRMQNIGMAYQAHHPNQRVMFPFSCPQRLTWGEVDVKLTVGSIEKLGVMSTE